MRRLLLISKQRQPRFEQNYSIWLVVAWQFRLVRRSPMLKMRRQKRALTQHFTWLS